jgi:hypothetical protein
MEVGSLADWVSGLGSLAAVAIALAGYWIIARHRAADRRQSERATAYEIIAVVHEITNNILAIQNQIAEASNDIAVPAKGLRFRIINPIIGFSTEGDVRLPAGSAELLVRADAPELWNKATLLVNHNRALVSILKEYRSLWAETMPQLPILQEIPGEGLKASSHASDFEALKPELIKLDAVVVALQVQVEEAGHLAHAVAKDIGPVFKRYFKEPILHLSTAEPSSREGARESP